MSYSAASPRDELYVVPRKNWGVAFDALRKLMADKHDTEQVFILMNALGGDEEARSYQRLLRTVGGGQIAYRRVELAERLMDRAWLSTFAPGTVGAAYRAFVESTGYSAQGLAEISQAGASDLDAQHPYVWVGRRSRDIHDLWHILTGYKADEHLGEAALVAFSFAQLGGWGWAAIAIAAWLETLPNGLFNPVGQAIREGYRLGKEAAWLMAEDYEQLLHEPLDEARKRLRIGTPERYLAIPQAIRAQSLGQVPKAAESAHGLQSA